MFDRRAFILLCGALLLHGCARAGDEHAGRRSVRVAAASDLTHAFEALGREFERDTGVTAQFTFGATGLLARQLRERAPFDAFAAANAEFVDGVVAAGVCDGQTRAPYGRGHLALWTHIRAGSVPTRLDELLEPRFARIAIANPEHAPYGKAARQALTASGLWSQLSPRIVHAENVRQALQFADSGNAEVALVALSLVIDRDRARYLPIDQRLHGAIEQTLVACNHGQNGAGGREFARYVNGPRGRAVMKRFGFLLPGETLVSAQ
jgi:molybdate transport system substrate-binding protein